tara:strand:+ start:3579 stop:3773 length:195 start_codon:yes stop_codon:yes gene_type:complete
MASDKGNAIKWVATRKVDDYLEYLVSHTGWNPDKRFAKVFDTSAAGRKYLKEAGLKGTVRKHVS